MRYQFGRFAAALILVVVVLGPVTGFAAAEGARDMIGVCFRPWAPPGGEEFVAQATVPPLDGTDHFGFRYYANDGGRWAYVC